MKQSTEKTNVMRLLEQKKISYKEYTYAATGAVAGLEVAAALGENPDQVFKTLVTRSGTNRYYVFLVPVSGELDLKKAAKAVKEKSIEMIKSKELLPLTGYIHGGCSPIGMKKPFPTVIDRSAAKFETILFSGGKIGYQVEVALEDLKKILKFELADVNAGVSEDTLWDKIASLQGETFRTSGRNGTGSVEFTYSVKKDKNGGWCGELFVSTKEKSITKATVMEAYRRALELNGAVSGPKKLGTFGASYLYSIFARLGVIETPNANTETELVFSTGLRYNNSHKGG